MNNDYNDQKELLLNSIPLLTPKELETVFELLFAKEDKFELLRKVVENTKGGF
jgi:hypothetical protein